MTPRETLALLAACFGSALVVGGISMAFGVAGGLVAGGVLLLALGVLIGLGA